MTARQFRGWVLAALALLVLVLVGRLAVAVYDEAHPRSITVYCDGTSEGWGRSYYGPADLVLGACQMAAGTNNP